MAAFAYAKILENFPPCCAPCKNTYKEVIAEPIGDSKLPIGNILKSDLITQY